MFCQCAPGLCLRHLRLRTLELCSGAGNVEAGRKAAVVTRDGQVQGLAISGDGILQQGDFAVQAAQGDVLLRQLRLQAEPRRFQVGLLRFGACLAGSDEVAYAAP